MAAGQLQVEGNAVWIERKWKVVERQEVTARLGDEINHTTSWCIYRHKLICFDPVPLDANQTAPIWRPLAVQVIISEEERSCTCVHAVQFKRTNEHKMDVV